MKTINVTKLKSSHLNPSFSSVSSIIVEDSSFGSGAFAEVYKSKKIDGKALPVPQGVKIFYDLNSAKKCIETIRQLQDEIVKYNKQLKSTKERNPIEDVSALQALPQFTFEGTLNGKTVVGYSANYLDKNDGWVLFDKIANGDEDDIKNQFIERSKFYKLPPAIRLKMAHSLAEGFSYLRSMNFIHADLNPKNFFVNTKNGQICLIDYDAGAVMDARGRAPVTYGTPAQPEWLAPEILNQLMTSNKATQTVDLHTDTWSVAMGIHYLLVRPFHPLFYIASAKSGHTERGISTESEYLKNYQWPNVNKNYKDYIKEYSSTGAYDQYVSILGKIPDGIKKAMSVTFNEGHSDPDRRASYNQWLRAIEAQMPQKSQPTKVTKNKQPSVPSTQKTSPTIPVPPSSVVTSVIISPPNATVAKGQTQQFTATVNGTGYQSQNVTWKVTGGGSGTDINSTGLLTIAANENAQSLTVIATSTVDKSKDSTANVKVPVQTKRDLHTYRESIAKFQNCIFISGPTVSLKSDGTVVAVGNNSYGQCDIGSWRRIVAIAVGGYGHTVGLKADGKVVAVGDNRVGQCGTRSWRDIITIYCGNERTFGLKADGTVVATGLNDNGQCNTKNWQDIIAIATDTHHTVGLKADGTVVAVGHNGRGQCNTGSWRDIVAIAAYELRTVGLKSNGTVVAVGENGAGQCNTENWRDIVAIVAAHKHTVGLKTDGTVVATGLNDSGQCNTENWLDIVAIAADYAHTVGLKADGTVVATGNNEYGQCNTGSWRDIVAIATGFITTAGLKSDSTVVAVGVNSYGQCNTDTMSWRNIGPVPKEQIWEWRGLCKYCGGKFIFLEKKCKSCGREN